MFTINRIFTGITHIKDAMGVCLTLIEGTDRAVLFDTGYGMEDVGEFVRSLTGKPVKVYLSHSHHDHVLGARWFDNTWICSEDVEEFHLRTGSIQRTKVAKQAIERRVALPDGFMEAKIPEPEKIIFPETNDIFENFTEDLGEIQISVIHVPGHTPGSIVIYVPTHDLLLTGDDWNPCTWMWFPTSLNAIEWRQNMISLIRSLEEEKGHAIQNVLCSHQPMIRKGTEIKAFLDYMTEERMKNAPAVDMGATINTHRIAKEPEGWELVFDIDKNVLLRN